MSRGRPAVGERDKLGGGYAELGVSTLGEVQGGDVAPRRRAAFDPAPPVPTYRPTALSVPPPVCPTLQVPRRMMPYQRKPKKRVYLVK